MIEPCRRGGIVPGRRDAYSRHTPATAIRYGLPRDGDVTLRVFDILGRNVATLVNESEEAGFRTVEWDGSNGADNPVGSGVYCSELRSGGFTEIRKMMLLK